jgi:hypothetical protein
MGLRTVKEAHPATTDTNGTTWYRPQRRGDVSFSQWGWTSDPAQAHEDYKEDK